MRRIFALILSVLMIVCAVGTPVAEEDFGFGVLTQAGSVQGTGYEHGGIDIHCAMGTPIYACADGTITYSEAGHTSNNKPHETAFSVKIKLATPFTYNGYKYVSAFYTHFSKLVYDVAEGSKKSGTIAVKRGDLLGWSGTANYAPHLHFSFETGTAQSCRMMKTSELIEVLKLSYGQKWSGYDPESDTQDSYEKLQDSAYPTPVTAYTQLAEPVQMYNRIYGNEAGVFDGTSGPLTINTVYHNGWVKVSCVIDGTSRVRYCYLSSFITQKLSPYSMTVTKNTKVYGREDMTQVLGTVYSTDIFTVVNTNGTALQILYPLDAGGFKLGWIDAAAAAQSVPEDSSTALIINTESGYARTEEGLLTGVGADSMVNAVLSNFTNTALRIEGAQNNMVGTGSTVELYNTSGSVDAVRVVVTGDLSGDGAVSAIDLLALERYFLGTHLLDETTYTAAKISGNETISAADMLLMKKQVQQTNEETPTE